MSEYDPYVEVARSISSNIAHGEPIQVEDDLRYVSTRLRCLSDFLKESGQLRDALLAADLKLVVLILDKKIRANPVDAPMDVPDGWEVVDVTVNTKLPGQRVCEVKLRRVQDLPNARAGI